MACFYQYWRLLAAPELQWYLELLTLLRLLQRAYSSPPTNESYIDFEHRAGYSHIQAIRNLGSSTSPKVGTERDDDGVLKPHFPGSHLHAYGRELL